MKLIRSFCILLLLCYVPGKARASQCTAYFQIKNVATITNTDILKDLFTDSTLAKIQASHPEKDHHIFFEKIARFLVSKIQEQHALVQNPHEIYIIETQKIVDWIQKAIREKRVTYEVFLLITNLAADYFSKEFSSSYRIYNETLPLTDSARRQALNAHERFIISYFKRYNFVLIPFFEELDFFNFFEFGPKVLPLGMSFEQTVVFDGAIQSSKRFRSHDIEHALDIMDSYHRLTNDEKSKYDKIFNFLKVYSRTLNHKDRLILGSVLFYYQHEITSLRDFIDFFELHTPNFESSNELLTSFEQIYRKFHNPEDFGATKGSELILQMRLTEFESYAQNLLQNMARSYQAVSN